VELGRTRDDRALHPEFGRLRVSPERLQNFFFVFKLDFKR
jgi:hypothetical protein